MKRTILTIAILIFAIAIRAQDYMVAMHEAWNNGNYPAVIENATKLLISSPKSVEGYYYRAMANMNNKVYGDAIRDMSFAIKFWSKNDTVADISAMYDIRARIYLLTDDTVNALKDFTFAINKRPDNPELYVNRAKVYEKHHEYANAEADYEKALELLQYDVNVEMSIARCQISQYKNAEARQTLSRVVKMNPLNDEAKLLLAQICRAENDIKCFVDNYVEYLELASDGDDELLVESSRQKYDYTASAISKMLAKTKYRKYWLSISVKVDMASGYYDKAVSALRQIDSINGDSIVMPFVMYRYALCYTELREYSKAVKYYTQLIGIEESDNRVDAEDLYGRGFCYEKTGLYEKAMEDYNRAVKLNGKNVKYLLRRGALNEKMKNPQSARSDYDKAISADKSCAEAYLLRGKLTMRDFNDTVAAMTFFESVLRVDTVVTVNSQRAQALHFVGRDDEAKLWMKQMLELNVPSVYYAAACVYSLTGDAKAAVVNLEKYFEKGYFNYAQVQTERDFDDVREVAEFKTLIDKYRNKRLQGLFDTFGGNK